MTDDEKADLALLSLANEKNKFALQLGFNGDLSQQMAFERGIDGDWFNLVDVSPIAEHPDRLFRVFKLTDAGQRRRMTLRRASAS